MIEQSKRKLKSKASFASK